MTLHSFLLRWGLDKEVKSAMGWERLDKPEICSFPDFIQRSPTKSLQDSVAAPTGKEANVLFFASRPPPSVEFPSSSFSLHSLLTQSQMPPNYPWVVQNCSFCSGLETSVIDLRVQTVAFEHVISVPRLLWKESKPNGY